jgi:uncharacterized membrane protein
MPVRRLQTNILVRAPRRDVFRWVGDYRNAPTALEGVRRWDPLDPSRTTGAGARFSVRIAILGLSAGTTLELDTWDEPATIGWHANGGPMEVRGRWTFAEHPLGTDVTLFLEYEPPGGLLGSLGADRLAGIGRSRLQAGLQAMRESVEAQQR